MGLTRLIYLIGPSGVRKTTCALAAVAALNAKLHTLDNLCRGRTGDWHYCNETMLKVENSDERHQHLDIIDLGAGTQHACNRELSEFLRIRRTQAMLIWAPPAEVIKRNPCGPNRNSQEFLRTEFTSRGLLYSIPSHRLDLSSLPEAESADRFTSLLLENSFVNRQGKLASGSLSISTQLRATQHSSLLLHRRNCLLIRWKKCPPLS